MVFCVDSIGKLSNVPFIKNLDIFFLCNLSIYYVYSVTDKDYFSDFPEN